MKAKAEPWQSLVEQLERQWAVVLQGDYEAEDVHQARVLIRQLRSLLSAVKKEIPPQEYDAWQEEWRRLSQLLAGLRQWDVLAESWRLLEQELGGLVSGHPELNCRQKRQAEIERIRVQAELALQTHLRERFFVWLAAYRQRVPKKVERKCAKKRMDKWAGRLDVLLPEEDGCVEAEQIHQCRIAGKKMRYVLELFFPQEAEPLVAALKQWQALLGSIHDSETHRRCLFFKQGEGLLPVQACALLTGWEAGQAAQARKQVKKQGEAVLRLCWKWRRTR